MAKSSSGAMMRSAPVREMATHQKERGGALLAFALLLIIGVIGYFTGSVLRGGVPGGLDKRESMTQNALRQAKESLIARAVLDAVPGRMPCPEDTGKIGGSYEGDAQSTCSNTSTLIGRLPWRTLKHEKLTDRYGEPLWYVLSPGFRSEPLNSETPGQLTLDDRTDIVALVIAPGSALSTQLRSAPSSASPPDPANYLDLSNKDGNPKFISTGPTDSFNDRVIAITRSELFAQVERRVARDVRYAMLEHFCGQDNVNTLEGKCLLAAGGVRTFPAPAAIADTNCLGAAAISTNCASDPTPAAAPTPLFGRVPANPAVAWEPSSSTILRGQTGGSPPNWFQRNKWRELVFYAVSQKCIDSTTNCNGTGDKPILHKPPEADQENYVTILVAGSVLAGQSRTNSAAKLVRSNYLEQGNSTGANDFYKLTFGSTFNDTVETIRLP